MREVLRPQTNIPEMISLAFDEGRKVEGRFGDQVMFTLADERVVYVPPIVESKINQLGIRKGDQFELLKKEVVNGTRKSIEWYVTRVNATGPAACSQAAKPQEQAPRPESRSGDQPQSTPTSAPKVNGNGSGHVPVPYAGTEAGNFLLSALVNSVDIWLATQQYARVKGLELAVTSEDVRALAITAFIQTRSGR